MGTAAQQSITFAVNFPGSPPYLYVDQQTEQYIGLVVDFFKTMEKETGLAVRYIDVNRERSEQFIYEGKADAFLSSAAWLKHPEKAISTAKLSDNITYLYSTTSFSEDFTLASLSTEYICTRKSYLYPTLQAYFDKSHRRVDSSSQATMLSMMMGGRCKYAVLNQYNALSLFSADPFCEVTFYRSPIVVNSVPNAFILSKRKTELAEQINHYLLKFIQSGEHKASLSRHTTQFNGGCKRKRYLPP